MIAGESGWQPFMEVHFDNIEVTSTLNDIKPLKAESCRVRSALGVPRALTNILADPGGLAGATGVE